LGKPWIKGSISQKIKSLKKFLLKSFIDLFNKKIIKISKTFDFYKKFLKSKSSSTISGQVEV
jgi:hypothetical protein